MAIENKKNTSTFFSVIKLKGSWIKDVEFDISIKLCDSELMYDLQQIDLSKCYLLRSLQVS